MEKILVARSLVDRQDVEVINLNINWRTKPPLVELNVRAVEPITPKEVAMVEDLLKQELEQPFTVIFDVTPSREVKSTR